MIKTIGKHLLYLLTGILALGVATIVAIVLGAILAWILTTIKNIFGLYNTVESLYFICWAIIIPVIIYSIGRGILESWLEYKEKRE